MPTNTYDKGDGVRLWADFKANAVFADPTTISLYVQDPDRIETTYIYTAIGSVQRLSTGRYFYDLEITKSGQWHYKYEGAGAVNQTSESAFIVRRSEFP